MKKPSGSDPDSVYQQWLSSRREPPDIRLDEAVMGWVDETTDPESTAVDLSRVDRWSLRGVAAQVVRTAVVAAAVVVCVTRVCLVIFPFSELH